MITPHTEKAARRFLHNNSMIKQRRQVKTGPLTYLAKYVAKDCCIRVLLCPNIVKERSRHKRVLRETFDTVNPTSVSHAWNTVSVCEIKEDPHFKVHAVYAMQFSGKFCLDWKAQFSWVKDFKIADILLIWENTPCLNCVKWLEAINFLFPIQRLHNKAPLGISLVVNYEMIP